MHQEYYDSGKLLVRAAGWGGFALLCLWIGGFFGVLMGILTLLVALAYGSKLAGDRVAIRFGQDEVELHGLGQSVTKRWDDIEDVTIVPMRSRMFGFLPTFRSAQLTLVAESNRAPLDVGVPVGLLALDREGLLRLVKVMIMSRAGGFDLVDPRTGEVRPDLPASPSGPPSVPAGFGRKGL